MMKRVLLFLLLMTLAAPMASAQYMHQPGDKAFDFEGTTVDGRYYHLYESQAENIIICFWSVDCDYCHDFMRQLRRHRCRIKGYELVTFALAESPEEVLEETKRMRVKGWYFHDPAGWDSEPFLQYDVNITPTIVLIDKERNIVGEAFDWEEFRELIDKR